MLTKGQDLCQLPNNQVFTLEDRDNNKFVFKKKQDESSIYFYDESRRDCRQEPLNSTGAIKPHNTYNVECQGVILASRERDSQGMDRFNHGFEEQVERKRKEERNSEYVRALSIHLTGLIPPGDGFSTACRN